MKFIGILCLPAILTACTHVELRANQLDSDLEKGRAEVAACLSAARANSNSQALGLKLAFQPPSLQQLMDDSKPTKAEISLLLNYHQHIQPCRRLILEWAGKTIPVLISHWAEVFAKNDAIYVALAKQEITWGEANTRQKNINDEFTAKYRVTLEETDRKLQTAHEMELQDRQAATAAFRNWRYQQQLLKAAQQRNQQTFTMTNCQIVGNSIQCTSF